MNSVLLATVIAVTATTAPLPLGGQPLDSQLIVAQASAPAPATSKPHQLNLENKPWKGDFDAMLERRIIRVLVPYSRTLYFVDKGRERGHHRRPRARLRALPQQEVREEARQAARHGLLIPTTRDKLLSGRGRRPRRHRRGQPDRDRRSGGRSSTSSRRATASRCGSCSSPGRTRARVATLDDLSGKTVHVRQATSYHESVVALNERLTAAGKAPAVSRRAAGRARGRGRARDAECGPGRLSVVDDWKARMWAQVLPKIKVRDDLVLRDGCAIPAGRCARAARSWSRRSRTSTRQLRQEAGREAPPRRSIHRRVKQITTTPSSGRVAALRRHAQAVREVRRRSTASIR